MTKIAIFSSPAFDRIARILVTENATMANVSLYLWFAKYIDYDTYKANIFHNNLLSYIETGNPTSYLLELTQDFPSMFSWFGGDIVKSESAVNLMGEIANEMKSFESILPYDHVGKSTDYLNSLHLTDFMEELTGCQWPTETLKLVAANPIFNQMYVYPNTIICRPDQKYAEYVAMIAHEGGHILSLNIVNDPEIRKSTDRALTGNMAEALAHAIQMCAVDKYDISYEDLFPAGSIRSHEDYFQKGHPWLSENKYLVLRLVEALKSRGSKPLTEIYQEIFWSLAKEEAPTQ